MENTTDDLFHNIFVYITKDTVIDPSLPPKLSKYGAVVALNLNKRITHVISHQNDTGDDLEQAKQLNVKIVTADFFQESIKINSLRHENDFIIKHKKAKPSSSPQYYRKKKIIPDKLCNNINSVNVYFDANCVWKCTLNQTSTALNSNKFYIIEIHETIAFPKRYSLWKRYGRVGYDGKGISTPMNSLEEAIQAFEDLFYKKTGNTWSLRHSFITKPNKYTLLEIDDDDDDDIDEDKNVNISSNVPDSKLDVRVQDLIKLIFDNSMMNNTAVKMNYNIKEQPLGKLSKKIIQKATHILKDIEDLLKNGISSGPKLDDLVNQFYTFIPHDFGFKKPTPINNLVILQEKIELLETLYQIKNANSLESSDNNANNVNPLDRKFSLLNLSIKPIDRNSDIWKILNKFVTNTHAPTHNHYYLSLLEVYEIEKEYERDNFIDLDNQMLLWHGSRLSNYVGILSQGLRIAPPEAPSTGYMFGKGIYFADICSKSANYCHATKEDNIGLLLLCQVSLGEMMKKTSEFFVTKLPPKYQSVMGVGKSHPDPNDFTTIDGKVKVPYGKTIRNPEVTDSALLYNEYIVYNTNQVKFRYLVKVRFNFK